MGATPGAEQFARHLREALAIGARIRVVGLHHAQRRAPGERLRILRRDGERALGELALLFNGENRIGADLTVVEMKSWNRDAWFDQTGLPWSNPSPNMRSLNAALLYPAVAMIEYARNYSVGRGTDAPFEQIGADWIKGPELAAALNQRWIPGVRVYPTRFTPAASHRCGIIKWPPSVGASRKLKQFNCLVTTSRWRR